MEAEFLKKLMTYFEKLLSRLREKLVKNFEKEKITRAALLR